SQFNTLNRSLNIDYQIDIPVESLQFANKPKNLEDVIKNPESVLAYESVRTFTQNQPDIRPKDKTIEDINPKLQNDIRNTLPDQTKETIIKQIQENCINNQLTNMTDFNFSVSQPTIEHLIQPSIFDTLDKNAKKQITQIINSVIG